MNFQFPSQFAGAGLPLFLAAYATGVVIVHIGFAAAVAADAGRLSRERTGPPIAGPVLWTLATFLGGVYVAGVDWVVNHSAISRRYDT
jgi:hypothetical protein